MVDSSEDIIALFCRFACLKLGLERFQFPLVGFTLLIHFKSCLHCSLLISDGLIPLGTCLNALNRSIQNGSYSDHRCQSQDNCLPSGTFQKLLIEVSFVSKEL